VHILESPDLLAGQARTGWDPYDTVRRILAVVNSDNYDLVHGFDCRPAVVFPALVLQKVNAIPFISDWADWWGRGGIIEERNVVLKYLFGPVETFFEEFFRSFAEGLTVTSHALGDRAVALGIAKERIQYIPSGCDVESIKPLPKQEVRQKLGLDRMTKIIEFIGFINYDFDMMLRSFPIVQQRFPDVMLLLVGQRYPFIEQLRKRYKIKKGILEIGIVPFQEIPMYLACADVLLLPFTNKICNIGRGPIKLGDYMAAGRPIITQPVGDLKNIFQDEEPIGLLAGDTPEEFAEAICYLLDNPDHAEQCGRNARKLAEKRYSWDQSTDTLESFYKRFA
jgi:glycosyltransferase involved in cell wall biosynthesis